MNPFYLAAGLVAVAVALFFVLRAAKSEPNDPDLAASTLKPLTRSDIFWSVFGALWCFSVTAGILLIILRAVNSL
jgi:hypothetical protein